MILALFCLNGRSFSQYALLKFEQLCPFDSAVAVHLPAYRLETLKFKSCDSIVACVDSMVRSYEMRIGHYEYALNYSYSLYEHEKAAVAIKEETIARLNDYNRDLNHALTSEERRNRRKWWWIAGGVVVGGVVGYLIGR